MKKRVNITIDEETLYNLDGMAYERGLDRSTMITLLVRLKMMERELDKGSDYFKDLPLDTPYLKAVFEE